MGRVLVPQLFLGDEAADHVTFSAAGWLGQRVHVVREAGVVIALFSSRPPALDDELGAHMFLACEDLARLLADDDRPLHGAGAEGD